MSHWQHIQSWKVKSVTELQAILTGLQKHFTKRMILCLEGPVGVGKTTLVHELLQSQTTEQVVSPTFALQHHYSLALVEVDHWDLYRLETEDELESAGFWDSFSSTNEKPHWIFVEWPEKINIDLWPRNWDVFRLLIQVEANVRELKLGRLKP